MTKISTTMTVGFVAGHYPESIAALERLGIEYCCGGNRTLEDAARSSGLSSDELVATLESCLKPHDGSEAPAWSKQPLRTLIQHVLDKHHVYTRDAVARLEKLLAKVLAAHSSDHPEVVALGADIRALCDDLGPHLMREERVLFPWIEAAERANEQGQPKPFAPFGTVRNPIAVMDRDHKLVGDLLQSLSQRTEGYTVPKWACPTVEALYRTLEGLARDLREHIHLENNVLFPRALEL